MLFRSKLRVEHYQHKVYGRTFVPVMEVVDWISLNGEPAAEAAPSDDTGRRRRG